MRAVVGVLLVILVVAAVAWTLSASRPMIAPPDAANSVAEELGGAGAEGFVRALEPREFEFPRDHGPHPDYRHEWWYYTGNLQSPEGRRFGFQLTFFRIALSPEPVAGESAWRSNAVYMAHFALTDVAAQQFHHTQRLSRDGLGLAGATPEAEAPQLPFSVWLEDWRVEAVPQQDCVAGPACETVALSAQAGGVELNLRLSATKAPVLQGERGLSRKSAEPGNASYYYSLTRLAAAGEIVLDDDRMPVTGTAWMDREWSTWALGPEQTGWDWFAQQFADGSELMYYQLRRRDGSADPHSAGVRVSRDGHVQSLGPEDLRIEVREYWISPETGVRYPAGWTLTLPGRKLELEISPVLADQELTETAVRYWEGAVDVRGRSDGRAVEGVGYVELAGYE